MFDLNQINVPELSGRSVFEELRRGLVVALLQMNQEMDSMVAASRVEGSPLYVVKHRIASKGERKDYFSLRWRRRFSDTQHLHVLWVDQVEVLDVMQPVVRKHYEGLNRRMLELNVLSSMVRHDLNALETFFKRSGSV